MQTSAVTAQAPSPAAHQVVGYHGFCSLSEPQGPHPVLRRNKSLTVINQCAPSGTSLAFWPWKLAARLTAFSGAKTMDPKHLLAA